MSKFRSREDVGDDGYPLATNPTTQPPHPTTPLTPPRLTGKGGIQSLPYLTGFSLGSYVVPCGHPGNQKWMGSFALLEQEHLAPALRQSEQSGTRQLFPLVGAGCCRLQQAQWLLLERWLGRGRWMFRFRVLLISSGVVVMMAAERQEASL